MVDLGPVPGRGRVADYEHPAARAAGGRRVAGGRRPATRSTVGALVQRVPVARRVRRRDPRRDADLLRDALAG